MELFITNTDQHLNVHSQSDCRGEVCPIHAPLDHHMLDWPMHWRSDRKIFERACPHGIGHPDPSDMATKSFLTADDGWDVHGCDGCCRPHEVTLEDLLP